MAVRIPEEDIRRNRENKDSENRSLLALLTVRL
jgi:hypothetical protein